MRYIWLFVALFLKFSFSIDAQQSPAIALEKYVDKFSGDFNYSIPLVSIHGPNGELFSTSIDYNAGIRVNQEASWIGLGWDMVSGYEFRTG